MGEEQRGKGGCPKKVENENWEFDVVAKPAPRNLDAVESGLPAGRANQQAPLTPVAGDPFPPES